VDLEEHLRRGVPDLRREGRSLALIGLRLAAIALGQDLPLEVERLGGVVLDARGAL